MLLDQMKVVPVVGCDPTPVCGRVVTHYDELTVRESVGKLINKICFECGAHDSVDQVLGDFDWLDAHRQEVDAVAIGIGTPEARSTIGTQIRAEFINLGMPPLVHPTVRLDRGTCSLGDGVLLCAGTIATVNVVLEDFSMVNLACTLGHEARIGVGSVLNPTVNISGGVVLERSVLVGTGAQILQYVKVGEETIVGAGAVVTKDVQPGMTVVGAPAKPLERR